MGVSESEHLVLMPQIIWSWSHNSNSQYVLGWQRMLVYLSHSLAFTIHHSLNQSLSFLQALHQEKASLSTHYGAITGLAELGQEVGENKFYKMSEKIQEN